MRTGIALPVAAVGLRPVAGNHILFHVKQFLLKRICFLTSEKFTIFVCALSALGVYIGAVTGDERFTGISAIPFIIAFGANAARKLLRDHRQFNRGIKSIN